MNAAPERGFDPWASPDLVESVLADGSSMVVLPVRPGLADHDSLREELVKGFAELSAESRYRRFMVGTPELSLAMLRRLVDTVDDVDHVALVARVRDCEPPSLGRAVGIARFFRDADDPSAAEVAVTVVDDWQHRGVGDLLLRSLTGAARRRGVTRFVAEVLATNVSSFALLGHIGEVLLSPTVRGVVHVEVILDRPAPIDPLKARPPKLLQSKESLRAEHAGP